MSVETFFVKSGASNGVYDMMHTVRYSAYHMNLLAIWSETILPEILRRISHVRAWVPRMYKRIITIIILGTKTTFRGADTKLYPEYLDFLS